MRTEITPEQRDKIQQSLKEMIEELMFYIMQEHFEGKLDTNHRYFDLYLSLQKMLEDCQR